MKLILLALGGLSGTFARYLFSGAVHRCFGPRFPYGTFAVNVSGCFLIGLFASWSEERFALGPEARVLLMTGFCGAYTTFSTFILETSQLMRDGQHAAALGNVALSVVAGFLLFRAGWMAGRLG